MFTKLDKKIEIAANVTIIVVAVLLAIVAVKDHLLTREPNVVNARQSVNQPVDDPKQIANVTNLSSLEFDWTQSKQTLVLAISSACHFCTDSASFYKTLIQNKKDTRIVAVFPQPVEQGRNYLQKLGVSVDEIRQLPLNKIGVHGTPTLMLVDTSGSVKNSWVGKLPADKENDVLERLQL